MVAALRDEADVLELATQSFNARPLGDFLEQRFGLGRNHVPAEILEAHGYARSDTVAPYREMARLRALLRDLAPMILRQAEDERTAYLGYLEEVGLIGSDIHAAVVDIGYSGSMQKHLMRLLGRDLAGFYMLTHHHANRTFGGRVFEGYLASYDDHRAAYHHPLNDHVFLFETVLSSLEGSLVRVHGSEETRLELLTADCEGERVRFLRPVHDGVVQYTRDLVCSFGADTIQLLTPPLVAARLFLSFAAHPNERDARMFESLDVENKFGGGDARLIADKRALYDSHSDPALTRQAYEALVASSQWKRGAEAALRGYTRSRQPRPAAAPSNAVKPAPAPGGSAVRKPQGTPSSAATPTKSAAPANRAANGQSAAVDTPHRNRDTTRALSPSVRKFRKLQRDPERFFADSQNVVLRQVSVVFGEHPLGTRAQSLLRRMLGDT